jgi:uncharacterized protein YjiS (DUF1127 family)
MLCIVLLRATRAAASRFILWNERRESRRLLEEMDDHRLADIGLSRAEALGEARRPFWSGRAAARRSPAAGTTRERSIPASAAAQNRAVAKRARLQE